MPYIQFNDQQLALQIGDNSIGASAGAAVPLPAAGPDGAIVTLTAANEASIRVGSGQADVKVNGVKLGAEPAPLLHGDKIEVAGQALSYGEDRQAGSTQYLSRANIADLLKELSDVPEKPTVARGGRLVSLMDGREYTVPSTGVTIGRDPGSDIVVASGQVSRNHAEIDAGETGYYIIDTSTNGVYVNGRRVEGTQTLAKGDRIVIGDEEFRFYAEAGAEVGAGAEVDAEIEDEADLESDAELQPWEPPAPPVANPIPGVTTPPAIPSPRNATRVPVTQGEVSEHQIPWWVWTFVALLLAGGAYFVLMAR